MKNKHLYLFAALSFVGFTACNNTEEFIVKEADVAPTFAPSPFSLEFDESLFPTADKSKEIKVNEHVQPKTKIENFNTVVTTFIQPSAGLNRREIEATDEQLAEIKAKTDEILVTAKDDADKVRMLTAWVNKNVRYARDQNDVPAVPPHEVFKSLCAVCQGMSNLLRAMLYTQGIPAIAVNGMLGKVGGHAWVYAHADGQWWVSDPTNRTDIVPMKEVNKYTSLIPQTTNVDLYEDDNFVYNFYDYLVNVKIVKKSSERLVIPFSVKNIRIGSFNPKESLPKEVKHIYLGSNIQNLGEQTIVGLNNTFLSHEHEAVFIDEKNPKYIGHNGIVYTKVNKKPHNVVHIPSKMRVVKFAPIKKVGKNIIHNHNAVEEIVFAKGTKSIENFAIENCPNLRRVYVPTDCDVSPSAILKGSQNVEIIRGEYTGITKVRR